MPNFNYLVRDAQGRIQRGQLEATSPAAARSQLGARGGRLIKLQAVVVQPNAWEVVSDRINPLSWMPVRSIDVEVALQQLAVMLRGGLTLLAALRTVGEQARKRSMQRVCTSIANDIQEGSTLAQAFEKHRCFPPLVSQLARVGEQTGNLEMVLDRAAKQMARRRQNLTNLMTAMAYPAFVAVAALGVAVYLVVVVVPELEKFLSALGRQLPAMTQMLMDFSAWLQIHGPAVLVSLLALVLAGLLVYLWPPGRLWIDRWSLRVPIIGHVLRLSGTVAFSSALAVLVRSGITVLDGLRTVEQLHGNKYLALQVALARDSVIAGGNLSQPLAASDGFLPMLPSMVAVAESTGELDEVLEHVSEFHEEQLLASIKRLSALLEPAVIIVVGGIVGFVYLSFFLALFAAGGSM